MRKRNDHQLLREYISRILKEEEGYTSLAVAGIGASPGGSGEGDAGKKLFLQPLFDVFKIGIGKLKELQADTKSALKFAWGAALSSIIPTMNKGYKEIFNERDKEISSIKSTYRSVYDSAWSAFKNNDFAMLGFFYNPTAVLTSAFAKNAGNASLQVLDTIVAGSPVESAVDYFKQKWEKAGAEVPEKQTRSSKRSSDKYEKEPEKKKDTSVAKNNAQSKSSELMTKDRENAGRIRTLSLIRENKGKISLNKIPSEEYEKLVSQAMSTPRAKKMTSEAKKLVNDILGDIYKKAQDITNATSFDELKRLKLLSQDFKAPESNDPAEQKKNEQLLFDIVRESMKKNFILKLQDNIKSAVEAGVPENSDFIAAHEKVIKAIGAL